MTLILGTFLLIVENVREKNMTAGVLAKNIGKLHGKP